MVSGKQKLAIGIAVFAIFVTPWLQFKILTTLAWTCHYFFTFSQWKTAITLQGFFAEWSEDLCVRYNLRPRVPAIPFGEIAAKDYSIKEFERVSKGFMYPTVVRGIFKGSYADQHWSMEYLKGKVGKDWKMTYVQGSHPNRAVVQFFTDNAEHIMSDGNATRFSGNMRVVSAEEEVADIDRDPNLINSDGLQYLIELQKRNGIAHSIDGLGTLTILQENPELLRDLEFRRLGRDLFKGYSMMFSEEQGYVPLHLHVPLTFRNETHFPRSYYHSALVTNLFLNVRGRKRWHVTPPWESIHLRGAIHVGKPPLAMTGSVGKYVEVEDDEDFYQRIERWEVNLEEGDLLFLPPLWWHRINCWTKLCLSVATRDMMMGNAFKSSFGTMTSMITGQILSHLLDFRAPKVMAVKDRYSCCMEARSSVSTTSGGTAPTA